jgi:hypothetical protein
MRDGLEELTEILMPKRKRTAKKPASPKPKPKPKKTTA